MPSDLIFHERNALALDGLGENRGGLALDGLCLVKRGGNLLEIVAVDLEYLEAERLKLLVNGFNAHFVNRTAVNHTLVVVVRYFGGIKLGAGGLVRAYTKSLTETLKISLFDELEDGYQIQISFPYEEEKNVNYLLGNSLITKKDYLENITYTCFVNFDLYDKILPYHPLILEKCIIKKTP